MRVLQFLPSVESESGGPVRSTLATCRAVHRVDAKVDTVWISTRHRVQQSWETELKTLLPPRMSLRLFPQFGRHTQNISPALLGWLWKHLPEFDLLVVRALLHPLTFAVGWIARRRAVPYVVVPHGTLSEWTFRHRRRLLKRVYYGCFDSRTLEGAGAIRFTSEKERCQAERLGFRTRSVVIPHPFERGGSYPSIDRDPDQILFLSRLHPKKGIDVLLDALVLARKQRPSVRLVLAGSGSEAYERELGSMIRERGLGDAIEMPGFVRGKEKEKLLLQSSVFALPSYQENFGIAAVEALDAGLPIVISPSVGVARDVGDYDAGYVVESSPESVGNAILAVLRDRRRQGTMAERARRLVREKFAPEVVGPQVVELYRSVAQRS